MDLNLNVICASAVDDTSLNVALAQSSGRPWLENFHRSSSCSHAHLLLRAPGFHLDLALPVHGFSLVQRYVVFAPGPAQFACHSSAQLEMSTRL
jgi:hypothetical protein